MSSPQHLYPQYSQGKQVYLNVLYQKLSTNNILLLKYADQQTQTDQMLRFQYLKQNLEFWFVLCRNVYVTQAFCCCCLLHSWTFLSWLCLRFFSHCLQNAHLTYTHANQHSNSPPLCLSIHATHHISLLIRHRWSIPSNACG